MKVKQDVIVEIQPEVGQHHDKMTEWCDFQKHPF